MFLSVDREVATPTAEALIDRAIEAAGGLDLWRGADYVEAEFDARGALFKAKWRPVQRNVTVRVATSGQLVAMEPYPGKGQGGVLDGGDVSLLRDGKLTELRADARSAFEGSRRRWVRWDDLDFMYFAGAAMWTYLSTPFVLAADERIQAVPGPVHEEEGEVWDTLDVTFPAAIATHCAEQRFYIDAQGLIRRHDYTAEVISRRARGAHMSGSHADFEGLTIATRRRVYPRGSRRRVLPGPVLVAIDIHRARLVRGMSLRSRLGIADTGH